MSVSQEYLDFCRELLAGLGPIRAKRMFGAAGLYCDDIFFAVVDDDTLYIKVDDETEPLFREGGSQPAIITDSKGETIPLRYWRMPDAALDEPEEAVRWARLGVEAALRKKSGKRKRA